MFAYLRHMLVVNAEKTRREKRFNTGKATNNIFQLNTSFLGQNISAVTNGNFFCHDVILSLFLNY